MAHAWLPAAGPGVEHAPKLPTPEVFAHYFRRFGKLSEATLAAVNLLSGPSDFGKALAWGENQVGPVLPLVQKMLEPVVWVAPHHRLPAAA